MCDCCCCAIFYMLVFAVDSSQSVQICHLAAASLSRLFDIPRGCADVGRILTPTRPVHGFGLATETASTNAACLHGCLHIWSQAKQLRCER